MTRAGSTLSTAPEDPFIEKLPFRDEKSSGDETRQHVICIKKCRLL